MSVTALVDYRSNRIVKLMEEPVERRDAAWFRESLQQAVLLELATLPPYLCGLWSIEDPSQDEGVFHASPLPGGSGETYGPEFRYVPVQLPD